MIISCFALMEPFSPMHWQFEVIRLLGIDYTDLTDSRDGPTTLEVTGAENVKLSAECLRGWST